MDLGIVSRPETRVAVAYRDLVSGDRSNFNGNDSFHPASTIKLAVMMAAFRYLDLAEELPIRNSFVSLANGLDFQIDQEEDSDPRLYDSVGSSVGVVSLVERMIVRSSNLATNLLVDRLGVMRIAQVCQDAMASGVVVRRGVEDGAAFRAGLNNEATANGLCALLMAIANDRSSNGEAMRSILLRQEFNEGIPAGLPSGTQVAHKTGWTSTVYHDAGIVYPEGATPYVLVVMTEGFGERAEAQARVAQVASAVHEMRSSGPEFPWEG
jgi:beta-lactamase class A